LPDALEMGDLLLNHRLGIVRPKVGIGDESISALLVSMPDNVGQYLAFDGRIFDFYTLKLVVKCANFVEFHVHNPKLDIIAHIYPLFTDFID
jgi:hypothetical protein